MTGKMRYRINSLVDSAFLSIFVSGSESQVDRQPGGAYQIIQHV